MGWNPVRIIHNKKIFSSGLIIFWFDNVSNHDKNNNDDTDVAEKQMN